jgi:hypothetical protein
MASRGVVPAAAVLRVFQRAEHGLDIVCELLAVWGESEARAGGAAEQPGAGGGFELGEPAQGPLRGAEPTPHDLRGL